MREMIDESLRGAGSREIGIFSLRSVVRDAILVVVGCFLVASLVNLLRKDAIPFIQQEEYQILVPCPEIQGDAKPIAVKDIILSDPGTLFLDARPKSDFDRWHVKGALNVAYDYLEPVEAKMLDKIASSGSNNVVVYGDGGDPDSGEHLAKEISGRGIRNVGYIQGGALVLKKLSKMRSK